LARKTPKGKWFFCFRMYNFVKVHTFDIKQKAKPPKKSVFAIVYAGDVQRVTI